MISQAEIEAAARVINRELGCHGGPTLAECVYMVVDGDCECARVAKIALDAAKAERDAATVKNLCS